MKWKEADGPVQGYKVRVRPISGEATAQTPVAPPPTWWFHRFTQNIELRFKMSQNRLKNRYFFFRRKTLKTRLVSDFVFSLIERCSI